MCYDACSDASYEGAGEAAGYEMTVTKRIECCSIGTEETAPAHSHCCEDGNGVAVNDAFAHHLWNKTKGSTNRTECCDGESNKFARIEAKEPFEDEACFACKKRQQFCTLICFSRISSCIWVCAESKCHDKR